MKLTIRPYSDRKKPHLKFTIAYRDGEGKRKREFFRTKREGQLRLARLEADYHSVGNTAHSLADKTKREVVGCLEKLEPTGRSLTEAVNYFLEHLDATQKSETIAVVNGFFLEAKQSAGLSERHLQDLRYRTTDFVKSFGDCFVSEITTRHVNEWLAGLQGAAQSRNNTRRVVSGFFKFAQANGYTAENPVLKSEKFKVEDDGEIGIFEPAEMRAMLSQAEGDILAHLAIGGFAGLRDSEIARLDWKQVNLEKMFIDLRGNKTAKTKAARRLVAIQPNLAKWLEPFEFESGPVRGPNFRKRFDAFKAKLTAPDAHRPIPWVNNGLRHSFASHHIAHWKDSGKTALELGHSNSAVVYAHYREVVSDEDAAAWWSIEPDAAAKVVQMEAAQ